MNGGKIGEGRGGGGSTKEGRVLVQECDAYSETSLIPFASRVKQSVK